MRPGRARPGYWAPYNLLAAMTNSSRFRAVREFPCRRHFFGTSGVLAIAPNLPGINMLHGFERFPVILRCLATRTDSAELATADFGVRHRIGNPLKRVHHHTTTA